MPKAIPAYNLHDVRTLAKKRLLRNTNQVVDLNGVF